MSETFVKERPLPTTMTGLSAKGDKDAPKGPVRWMMLRCSWPFANGALGSFEATRFAPGHRCTNSFEINGSKGSVKFDLSDERAAGIFHGRCRRCAGFRRVLATDPAHA